MPTAGHVSHEHIDKIVEVLADDAAGSPLGLQRYFRHIVSQANLPKRWENQLLGAWTGVPDYDARELVRWALGKGGNPEDPRYTTLGSLLQVLLPSLGVEKSRWIAVMIVAYTLYRDDALVSDLAARYNIPSQIPRAVPGVAEKQLETGPDIDWQGPTEEVQLQSWLAPEPDFQDVGFLMSAMRRASSVCRIELEQAKRQGTGFLIGKTLVLTNYHVLKGRPDEDVEDNARDAVLRFGKITEGSGEEAKGEAFRLVTDQPVLKYSPANQLDYALLRVEDKIQYAQKGEDKRIEPAPVTLDLPYEKMELHILQHPEGKSMKLALSGDGVVKVIEDKALVQYATRARGGSSGSPCFTDKWEVIALHHKERSRSFGSIREGIIFRSIQKEIKAWL